LCGVNILEQMNLPKDNLNEDIPMDKSRTKLTSSGEIEELEELLKQKREEKEHMDRKYKPIVQFVTHAIKEDNLDYKLVLQLIADQFEDE
jgi:hypothetical protein